MKTILCLLLLYALPASAQDFTGLVASTKAQLEARGMNLQGACGSAQITVRVAYALKDQGYGLLLKPAGFRAIFLPDGRCVTQDDSNLPGYASDYIIQAGSFFGWDILEDAGGKNGPHWDGPEREFADRNRANFAVAPNLDNTPAPIPIQIPGPSPQPIPQLPPISTIDYSDVLQQILDAQNQLLQSQAELLTISKDTNAHVANIDHTFAQTIGHISAFLGKYVGPAVAGYIAAKKIGQP